jgi:hypothetical protein
MVETVGTTEFRQPHLLDLSGVPLDELGGVDGLSTALASLRGQLAYTAAPLSQTGMTARCGGHLLTQPGSSHES